MSVNRRARLPAGVFYGIIAAGVLLGVSAAGGGAWLYLHSGEARPEGRRILADIANDLVVPIAAMMGGTFGGLAGFAAAVIARKWR